MRLKQASYVALLARQWHLLEVRLLVGLHLPRHGERRLPELVVHAVLEVAVQRYPLEREGAEQVPSEVRCVQW